MQNDLIPLNLEISCKFYVVTIETKYLVLMNPFTLTSKIGLLFQVIVIWQIPRIPKDPPRAKCLYLIQNLKSNRIPLKFHQI